MFDVSRYTVGWICAIHPELVAAKVHLELHETDFEAPDNDDNTYLFGSIARHNVVVACLPAGEYGLSSAATVARDMIRTFTNVKIGLMVGIAGGAPTQQQDIRLGDVVVSVPAQGKGGVHQYDFVKAVQGMEFTTIGQLNSPPKSLLSAVAKLRADITTEGHAIDESIATLLTPRLQKDFSRPDASTDRLYPTSYIHVGNAGCAVSCASGKLLMRPQREHEDVVIHYGLVASADTLVKDAVARDALAEHDVLCLEMEAAGLMNQLPFLVIRGICDYADSHKSKEWHGYAAMTAAAYAKMLLQELSPRKAQAERALVEVIGNVHDGVKEISHAMSAKHEDDREREMLRWLSAPDASMIYGKALEARHPGTGCWLLEDAAFQQRLQSERLHWLYGFSGCGKTILSATIIEHLSNQARVALYFYFDFQSVQKQTHDSMLRSLIRQLYDLQTASRGPLLQSYESCRRKAGSPSTRQLADTFGKMLGQCQQIYIVLDALDECSRRPDVFDWLNDMRHFDQLYFLITSRPEFDISTALRPLLSEQGASAISEVHVSNDIAVYIKHEVRHGRGLKRWRGRLDVQEMIEAALIQNADGIFRWAACQLDVLSRCIDLPSLRRALDTLPRDLCQTYTRILQAVQPDLAPHTSRVLQLLTFSERPLTCEEMIDALAVHIGEQLGFDVESRLPDGDDLALIVTSLVSLVDVEIPNHAYNMWQIAHEEPHKHRALRLAHSSVKEYLLSPYLERGFASQLSEEAARAELSKICLTYLLSIDYCAPAMMVQDAFPFASYAAEFWMSHAITLQSPDKHIRRMMLQLLDEGTKAYEFLATVWQHTKTWDYFWASTIPLLIVASSGVSSAVEALLEANGDSISPYVMGSALAAACENGHAAVADMLLKAGAYVNVPISGCTVLQYALVSKQLKVIQLLLKRGAKVDYDVLVDAAAMGQPQSIMRVLQKAVKASGHMLEWAAYKNQSEVAQLLYARLSKTGQARWKLRTNGGFCEIIDTYAKIKHSTTSPDPRNPVTLRISSIRKRLSISSQVYTRFNRAQARLLGKRCENPVHAAAQGVNGRPNNGYRGLHARYCRHCRARKLFSQTWRVVRSQKDKPTELFPGLPAQNVLLDLELSRYPADAPLAAHTCWLDDLNQQLTIG